MDNCIVIVETVQLSYYSYYTTIIYKIYNNYINDIMTSNVIELLIDELMMTTWAIKFAQDDYSINCY